MQNLAPLDQKIIQFWKFSRKVWDFLIKISKENFSNLYTPDAIAKWTYIDSCHYINKPECGALCADAPFFITPTKFVQNAKK